MSLSRRWVSFIFLLLAHMACQRQPTPTRTPPPTLLAVTPSITATPGMSAEARAYLDQALEIMEQHALHRQEINWKRLKSRTLVLAGSALTPADTYPAIESALGNLNDSHSRFFTPQQVDDLLSGNLMAGLPEPSGKLLDHGLVYLSVFDFAGSMEAGTAYAMNLQNILRKLDASAPCGWILDLRQNGGGDLWPMLAGLGPLLGEGLAGAFVNPDGTQEFWYYEHGQVRQGDELIIQINAASVYTLKAPLPPVAVLTGQGTGSSGEALMVAFRGRPLARSFGRESMGLSTANEIYPLSDGARIYLTVSRFADRTGQTYGGIITPDEYIRDEAATSDTVLEKASAWLLEQDRCTHQP
jgi:carboxyl-terminal processing protease